MTTSDWSQFLIAGAGAPVLSTLTTVRDWVIVVAGSMLILVFFIVFVFTFVLGLTARSLLSTVQTLLREEVSPLLNSARQSINTVQGTTAFIGETAVAPLIRAYGVVVGARRALGVLSGILPRQDRHE